MKRPARDVVIGLVRATRSGYCFLSPDSGGEDLMIARGGTGGAIHGDRVRAILRPSSGADFRPEAVVDEILERTRPLFTGEVRRSGKHFWVRSDSPLLPERIALKLGAVSPVAGDKILFRVVNVAGRDDALIAVFEQSLGEANDARLDPIVIATEYGLDLRFSDAALEAAEARAALAEGTDPEDARREDFRGQFVLTIDPIDAKDFDDAVALTRLADGGWELSVHIADVSFYVEEDAALDREALKRGTSVYFPGTVVPMLPEAISSAAASLRPEEDKRVLSAVMRFNARGERTGARFARGWIRSAARLHYAQAQAILDGDEQASPEISGTLREMWALALLLRARRFRDGAFDLDVPEVEMTLAADGVPNAVFLHESHDTNRLIEEFMIAANLAVGALGREKDLPLLYRVHDEPSATAIDAFIDTALTLAPGTRVKEIETLPNLRRWLAALPEGPLTRVLHRFFLRSMKKAKYDPEDVGHFGLAVEGYCHFTSPIRRYPDLWNHRRLKEHLDGQATARREALEERATEVGRLSSATEVNAEEADREMARLKTARFLERQVGSEFAGFVTALTPRGLFVELLRWPVEGFVVREGMPPGSRFLEDRMAWVQSRSGWELRPGDKVRVIVVAADVRNRRIDFALVPPDSRRRTGRGQARATAAERQSRRAAVNAGRKAGAKSARAGTGGRPGTAFGSKRAHGGKSAGGPKAGAKRGGRKGKKKR